VFLFFKDRPELTPVAIRAGKLLAYRLFNSSKVQMDYNMVRCSFATVSEIVSILDYSFDSLFIVCL